MASPEVVAPSGTLESSFHEELSAPEGWKKKLMLRKGGTPKRKDVVYIAPNGEEIRNKRQLEKYLKVHPGGPSSVDFDWTTGETPRRSARLSSKGRLSSDSTEAEPALKRSKKDADEEANTVVSPRKSSRRKSGPQAVDTVKDEVMEDAEKVEEAEDGTNTSADVVAVTSDEKPVEEKVAAIVTETVDNAMDEGHEEMEVVAVAIAELPATEDLTSFGNSADKVNAEEQVSKIEETVIVQDTSMEEATVVEVAVTAEQPAAPSIEEPEVEEVVKPSEGETSVNEVQEVKEVENQDIVDIPNSENLDGKNADPLKPKEHSESQGIHALIEEPVLSGVTKSPELTEPPLPAAERVGVST